METGILKRDEIFEFLRPDQVDIISDAAEVVELEAGSYVYSVGEPANYLYIVMSGQIALRLPGKGGVSILIDELTQGMMFGSCISFQIDTYALAAQCVEDSSVLRIETGVMRGLLDDDPRMGYAIQSKISQIYFQRYVEAANKLQAIVMNLPIELE
jgi:CRP-like cAMP-binding protein